MVKSKRERERALVLAIEFLLFLLLCFDSNLKRIWICEFYFLSFVVALAFKLRIMPNPKKQTFFDFYSATAHIEYFLRINVVFPQSQQKIDHCYKCNLKDLVSTR